MKKLSFLLLRWILAIIFALSYSLIYVIIAPLTLRVVYGFLRLFYKVSLEGNILVIEGVSLEFVSSCVAVSAYLLLIILILLTGKISISDRVKMFFYGFLLIFLANIIRIELLLFILVKFGVNYFETLHLFMWKVVSSFYVALVWIFLVWRFNVKGIPLFSDLKYVWKRFR